MKITPAKHAASTKALIDTVEGETFRTHIPKNIEKFSTRNLLKMQSNLGLIQNI